MENGVVASPTAIVWPLTPAMHAPKASAWRSGEGGDVVGHLAVVDRPDPFVGRLEVVPHGLGPRELARRDERRAVAVVSAADGHRYAGTRSGTTRAIVATAL